MLHELGHTPRLRRGLAAVGLVAALGLGSCATPVQYYASQGGALPELDERYRQGLLDQLAERLLESKIERVELIQGASRRDVVLQEGRSPELASFPLAALSAAVIGASVELRGAELDLVVGAEQRPPGTVVTVRHDLDHRLVLLPGGPPATLKGTAPSAFELVERFGIGPLLDGELAWSAGDRRALATALGLLSPAELAYLRYLPFRRDAGAPDSAHAGYYTSSAEGFSGGLVVLLDTAFASDARVFVGTPQRAYPQSISVILHELGHALSKLDRERLRAIYERDRKKYNELVDVFNEYVEALNARYQIVDRVRPSDRRRIEKDLAALEPNHRKLRGILREAASRLRKIVDMIEGPSPIETAYASLENARRGPTLYGSTSPVEGFAEAFALHHLDPESLRRFSREVHDWFAGGGHLSAALFPPFEDVAAPASVASGAASGPDEPVQPSP